MHDLHSPMSQLLLAMAQLKQIQAFATHERLGMLALEQEKSPKISIPTSLKMSAIRGSLSIGKIDGLATNLSHRNLLERGALDPPYLSVLLHPLKPSLGSRHH